MTARTSKSISERIEADYYKHPHYLRKLKRWLSWGILAGTLVLVLIPVLIGRKEVFQAAPVSKSHQFIANDCARCHAESWQPALRLVTFDKQHRSTTDAACRACHDTADHFGMLPDEPAPQCADCHREHRPGTNLAKSSDRFCIHCHATLTQRSSDGRQILPVGDIDRHPEMALFRSKEVRDPTKLKFNHRLHVAKTGIAGPEGKKVVLQCASCHEPDVARHLMKPVSYEAHCAECHSNSLQFDQDRFPGMAVPHDTPEVVRGFLREQYFRWAGDGSTSSSTLPKAPQPRTKEDQQAAYELERAALLKLLGESAAEPPGVDSAEYQVFARSGGCRYCHAVELVSETAAEVGTNGTAPSFWQVIPPEVPKRWFHGAVFPHVSHRMLTCVACHPVESSTATADINVPTMDNCKQCHSPEIAGSMAASSNCTSCHNYHDHGQDLNFNGGLTLELTKYLDARPPMNSENQPQADPDDEHGRAENDR